MTTISCRSLFYHLSTRVRVLQCHLLSDLLSCFQQPCPRLLLLNCLVAAPPAAPPAKRTSLSPQLMENAERLALALAQTPATEVPIITQPNEDMDCEKVTKVPAKQLPTPGKNLAPAPATSPPAEANKETRTTTRTWKPCTAITTQRTTANKQLEPP
jgi:hypothetical protein